MKENLSLIPMDYQKAKRSLHDARAERADGVSSCNSFEYSLKKTYLLSSI